MKLHNADIDWEKLSRGVYSRKALHQMNYVN